MADAVGARGVGGIVRAGEVVELTVTAGRRPEHRRVVADLALVVACSGAAPLRLVVVADDICARLVVVIADGSFGLLEAVHGSRCRR